MAAWLMRVQGRGSPSVDGVKGRAKSPLPWGFRGRQGRSPEWRCNGQTFANGGRRLDAGERHSSWGCNGGAAPLAKIARVVTRTSCAQR
jgi:hypothetical protein